MYKRVLGKKMRVSADGRIYRRGWQLYSHSKGPQEDTRAFLIMAGLFGRFIGFSFVRSCNPKMSSSFSGFFGKRTWYYRDGRWTTSTGAELDRFCAACSFWI